MSLAVSASISNGPAFMIPRKQIPLFSINGLLLLRYLHGMINLY